MRTEIDLNECEHFLKMDLDLRFDLSSISGKHSRNANSRGNNPNSIRKPNLKKK